MKKHLTFLLLSCFFATPSSAGLVLTGHSVVGTANMPLSSPEQIWIEKSLIRRDFTDRGRAYTHLFDLGKRQVVIIDQTLRTAELHDLGAIQTAANQSASLGGLKISVDPTGNSRPLRHWKCEEHLIKASLPARLGNEETLFHFEGKIWLARGVKEQAEVKELVKLAKKPQFFLGVPALAKVSPAQVQVISELIRKLAPKGLPCAGEAEATYEGSGPMANLAKRMPARLAVVIADFSRQDIPAETFTIPAGYQVLPPR